MFACDNNVVDNQMVAMRFVNGVNATLTMTAFTRKMGRIMTFHGTLGELELNESTGVFRISVFGQESKEMKISEVVAETVKDSFGHGGGDSGLVTTFYDMLAYGKTAGTSLESSVESHLMALAAEASRKTGAVCKVHN